MFDIKVVVEEVKNGLLCCRSITGPTLQEVREFQRHGLLSDFPCVFVQGDNVVVEYGDILYGDSIAQYTLFSVGNLMDGQTFNKQYARIQFILNLINSNSVRANSHGISKTCSCVKMGSEQYIARVYYSVKDVYPEWFPGLNVKNVKAINRQIYIEGFETTNMIDIESLYVRNYIYLAGDDLYTVIDGRARLHIMRGMVIDSHRFWNHIIPDITQGLKDMQALEIPSDQFYKYFTYSFRP